MGAAAAGYRTVLGVRFLVGDAGDAVDIGSRGGLVVVPAAPALIDLPRDRAYRDALLGADLAITDSGLMVLVWRLLTGERLPRTSGLAYLRALLARADLREAGTTMWVVPTERARTRTVAWLDANGVPCRDEDCYVAPFYSAGPIDDAALLAIVHERRPRQIVVGLGGGTQERLGLFLRQRLDYRPGIHCIGAALAFLTGDQVRIPVWADRFVLGWLFRCLSEPRKFVPRYWRAARLIPLMWRYQDRLPEPTA